MPLFVGGLIVAMLFIPLGDGAAIMPIGGHPHGPIKAVQLFRKPSLSTGQLEVVQEGLDALRAQTLPFAIVSAVGPTRTGKSSILGRTFLRGPAENLFEVGGGVTSHTGGVWMTSEPVVLTPEGGGDPIRVFIIDTEGFGGVGGLTSRTYEANLFGITYLLSSALIFVSHLNAPRPGWGPGRGPRFAS